MNKIRAPYVALLAEFIKELERAYPQVQAD